MKVEIDDLVLDILKDEAKSRNIDLEEMLDQILRTVSMRSRHNNGRVNFSASPTGLL